MPTISKKELEDYQQLCKDRNNGRILTPDGLKLVCEGLNKDPEAIGKHYCFGETEKTTGDDSAFLGCWL